MSITVLHPGLLATIQDLGRFGSQKYGVIVGGAMDAYSLRIANMLVGNEENEAVLELTILGTSIQFESDHLVAITGGDLQPTIDGETAPMWRPIYIRKGSILKFKSAVSGCRAYLAFAGGIEVPKIMGSKSTYLRAAIGGFNGRALQKGDKLLVGSPNSNISHAFINQLKRNNEHFTWSINFTQLLSFPNSFTIRFIRGSEYERFQVSSQQTFQTKQYVITTQADRMGYRLDGETLQLSEQFDLLSEGVTYGTIQVPSSGQPIILMADRQTTGGYPKIGQVITADLPILSQMQPLSKIFFKEATLEKAESLLMEKENILNQIASGIVIKALHEH
ncbi:biotin-dependent carboxyltransferase family protein [Lysinibacillus yapensis]|uniref:Biotin-dependent carboxyltransferase family protein n=1 Tax=Ureibacillus yapensis TaxID=2304605 RepID=A0A396S9H2_9BACL|nr:biotin-dependent carboxyltransferase family protein [Lysinibacillus yapensis]RHW37593.1 biotin-dependent carboxyltransferase family protein [Lysinibacillus yapensis]